MFKKKNKFFILGLTSKGLHLEVAVLVLDKDDEIDPELSMTNDEIVIPYKDIRNISKILKKEYIKLNMERIEVKARIRYNFELSEKIIPLDDLQKWTLHNYHRWFYSILVNDYLFNNLMHKYMPNFINSIGWYPGAKRYE